MITKQDLQSVAVAQIKSTGVVRPKVASEEALVSLERTPVKTVWGNDLGRPIYDRLPAISEQYKKGYDRDQAFVYLDPQFGQYEGPGSMEVVTFLDDPNILIVENGEITWHMGQVPVEGFNVDLTQLEAGNGAADGDYQVGYTLSYDVPVEDTLVPGYALASVENSTLGDAAISIGASGASQYHESYFAISDADIGTSWWPGINTVTGPYYPGSWFVIDFRALVSPKKFEIIADPNEPNPTAKLALYGSNDAIVWEEVNEVRPTGDRWIATVPKPTEFRYWKFFFWDGTASISDILYSGTAYFPDLRVSGPIQIATPYFGGLYEEPPEDFLLLATITVRNYRVGKITDFRRFTSKKYEPVSSWLTDFQDSNLRCVFEAVENYSEFYLNPVTADFHFYKELDDSVCLGLGEFELNGEIGTIYFPDLIEFICPGNKIAFITPTDPCGISPNQVILLKDPEEEGDLATFRYSNYVLYESWSIDNGVYH
jgi:hypothetical protein